MPSDPGFRRRSGRHDWSRPAGDGPLVSRVEVGDVEGHVPVSLPKGRLTGGGRLAACAGAGPVQQLEAVAQRRVDEHLDAQERSTAHTSTPGTRRGALHGPG